jgi:hypothetical protein
VTAGRQPTKAIMGLSTNLTTPEEDRRAQLVICAQAEREDVTIEDVRTALRRLGLLRRIDVDHGT